MQIALKKNEKLAALFRDSELSVEIEIEAVPAEKFERNLSKEAIALLDAAARDGSGTIMSLRYIGGHSIQTNGMKFGDSTDRRSMSVWEHALEQLVEQRMIVPRGYKNEVFEVTKLGYDVAEKMRKMAPQS